MNMIGISTADPAGLPCVGVSFAVQSLYRCVQRVAPFGSTVLVTGPSGTGKELIARQIHALSPRSEQLFVPVDCASMTGDLMASQIFGHIKGAFTSADQGSLGCFRAADRGTIFLDEIGELPLSLQAKLLRVIQERTVVPVGSHQASPVDVRIVAATNRDLRHEVAAGNFREDLFYRLSVVTIETVPLYRRTEDIPALSNHFLGELEAQGHPRHQITPGALEMLANYEWPGNVRELKNVLEQAALESNDYWISSEAVYRVLTPALCGLRMLDSQELPMAAVGSVTRLPGSRTAIDGAWPKLEESERRLIVDTLEHTYYNKSAAARLLDISRQSLIRKMMKFGISYPQR